MISVVIPCFNCEHFIDRAIASVYSQTYANWELILVDNNSSDNTLDILIKYQDNDPKRVTVISELKKGAPAARNAGLELAKGDWIQFLDADDTILPDKFLRQISLAEQSSCSIIASIAHVQIRKKPSSSDYKKEIYPKDQWSAVLLSKAGITSTNLWNKEEVLKAGSWDSSLSSSQEYRLIFNILKNGGTLAFDNEVGAIVYKDNSGISKAKGKGLMERIVNGKISLRVSILNFLKESKLIKNEHVEAFNNYVYLELMTIKGFLPVYVNDTLRQLNIHVCTSVVIKGYWLYFKSVIKRIIKWQ